jgi:hypothetical protein
VFSTRRDAEITIGIYRRVPVLWREDAAGGNPWNLQIRTRLWHMAEDAEHFRTGDSLAADGWQRDGSLHRKGDKLLVPLYEAKMLYPFDHRYGDYAMRQKGSESTILPEVQLSSLIDPTYAPTPRYWVEDEEVQSRLSGLWDRGWLLGWRGITHATNERTVLPSLLPRSAVGDTLLLMFPGTEATLTTSLYANLASFPLDYCARQKVGGISLKVFTMRQLPVLAPVTYDASTLWSSSRLLDWFRPRVLELTYTAWDLEAFGRDVGYVGAPFRWDLERRFLLRCELDAAFFHLYGLSRDDTDYVMDTFPIVRKNDEKAYGEYRTKRVILEIHDQMSETARTGRPYQTRLDPPPADPRIAHPDKRQQTEKH